MVNFLKLKNMILNTNNINKVLIFPDKYLIYTRNSNIQGLFICGSGVFDAVDKELIVCKDKNPEDYINVLEWVKKIDYVKI